MSYILDALKKSDEERMASLAKTPMQLAPARPARRLSLGWFVLPVVLVLLAGGWLLIVFQHDQDAVIPNADQSRKAVVQSNLPAPIMPAAQPHRKALSAQPDPKAAVHAPTTIATASHPDALHKPAPVQHLKKAQPAPVEIPATQEKAEPPRRSDLPIDIQQALPPVRIEGHIYDTTPSARMVIINGHVRREGQQLEGGLKLESITEAGIVLNWQGTRFRMGIFEH